MTAPFPTRDDWLSLHLRNLAGDPTATADVCARYLEPLCGWLCARFPRADEHQGQSAAEEAILAYLRHPERFDLDRGDLTAYLCRAARCDLLNLFRREQRHGRGRVGKNLVELDAWQGNHSRADDPCVLAERHEEAEAARAYLTRACEGFSSEERRVLDLLIDGERDTAVFVATLGLGELDPLEREREVKRVKDRVKKRLQRGGGR